MTDRELGRRPEQEIEDRALSVPAEDDQLRAVAARMTDDLDELSADEHARDDLQTCVPRASGDIEARAAISSSERRAACSARSPSAGEAVAGST